MICLQILIALFALNAIYCYDPSNYNYRKIYFVNEPQRIILKRSVRYNVETKQSGQNIDRIYDVGQLHKNGYIVFNEMDSKMDQSKKPFMDQTKFINPPSLENKRPYKRNNQIVKGDHDEATPTKFYQDIKGEILVHRPAPIIVKRPPTRVVVNHSPVVVNPSPVVFYRAPQAINPVKVYRPPPPPPTPPLRIKPVFLNFESVNGNQQYPHDHHHHHQHLTPVPEQNIAEPLHHYNQQNPEYCAQGNCHWGHNYPNQ